eukprot:1558245-Prymnesium_polylepis.1
MSAWGLRPFYGHVERFGFDPDGLVTSSEFLGQPPPLGYPDAAPRGMLDEEGNHWMLRNFDVAEVRLTRGASHPKPKPSAAVRASRGALSMAVPRFLSSPRCTRLVA